MNNRPMTLGKYHEQFWLPLRERRAACGKMTADSVAAEAAIYRNRIAPWIGGCLLGQITLPYAEQWRDARLAGGLSHQSVKHAVRILRQIVKQAHKDNILLGPNPLEDLKVEKRRGDTKAYAWVRKEELDQLLAFPSLTEMQRAAISLAVYTGLRLNEIKALHWGDVCMHDSFPHVVIRYGSVPSYQKGRMRFGPTKNGEVETIELLPQAVAALHRWQQAQGTPATHEHLDYNGQMPMGALVFGKKNGQPYGSDYDFDWAAQGYLASLPTRAFCRHVRFHDLRHTFCSHLALGTWLARPLTLLEIKAFARHRSIKSTERYAHLSQAHISGLVGGGENAARGNGTPADSTKARLQGALLALKQAQAAVQEAMQAMEDQNE